MSELQNRLLSRQVKKHLKDFDSLPQEVKDFVFSVQDSYSHYDQDRRLLDRAMELNSQELEQLLQKSRKESLNQKLVLDELKSILFELQEKEIKFNKFSRNSDAKELTTILRRELELKNKTRQDLIQNESALKSLIENTNNLIVSVCKDFKIDKFNSHFEKCYPVRNKSIKKGDRLVDVFPTDIANEWSSLFKKSFQLGETTEIMSYNVDGVKRYFEMSFKSILVDNENVGSTLYSRDITDVLEKEIQIEKKLREKEVLLKEIHHRVKNNMQVITSLLSLQSRRLNDDNSKVFFERTEGRVKSMALIHEMLYESDNLSVVNYEDYVKHLVNTLVVFTKGAGHNISLRLEIDELFFGMDTAIPLGLLINEIVTNSLKYGLKNSGEIHIGIQEKSEGKYLLQIGDNGVGDSEEMDLEQTETLGMQLIQYLVDQLEGTVELDHSKKGINYLINFEEI